MLISSSINIKELEALKNQIFRTQVKRSKPTNEHELLRIEDGDVFIVVYKSGKIVYEDNAATNRILDNVFITERKYDYELGSDEVGKGEWYGPLVVVCAALTPELVSKFRRLGAKDSKALSASELNRITTTLKKHRFVWKPLVLHPPTYNKMVEEFKKENKSLNELLAWAHSKAIRDTVDSLRFEKAQIVIDKFDVEKTYRRLYGIDEKKVTIIQKSKGESEIPVAVASILAKEIFEREVDELCNKYGMDLRSIDPKHIPKEILQEVAKLHFKNIQEIVNK